MIELPSCLRTAPAPAASAASACWWAGLFGLLVGGPLSDRPIEGGLDPSDVDVGLDRGHMPAAERTRGPGVDDLWLRSTRAR